MGVLCLSLILGVSSAYLIANYDFYFCKILEKLLILPWPYLLIFYPLFIWELWIFKDFFTKILALG